MTLPKAPDFRSAETYARDCIAILTAASEHARIAIELCARTDKAGRHKYTSRLQRAREAMAVAIAYHQDTLNPIKVNE